MSQEPEDDDLEPEYDFSGAVRGKYYQRYQQGRTWSCSMPMWLRPQGFGVGQPGSPPPSRSRQARGFPERLTLAYPARPAGGRDFVPVDTSGEPLLFKGNDFSKTDVAVVERRPPLTDQH
jgi:hypothetical protein